MACLGITPEPPLASKVTVKVVVSALAGLLRPGADKTAKANKAAVRKPIVFTFIGQY
jgi:hypothetical protein